jgi:hypothetical protein
MMRKRNGMQINKLSELVSNMLTANVCEICKSMLETCTQKRKALSTLIKVRRCVKSKIYFLRIEYLKMLSGNRPE